METGDAETLLPVARRPSSTSPSAATWTVPVEARASLLQRMNLLQRHGVAGHLKAQAAGVEAVRRVVEGGAQLDLLGARGELPRGQPHGVAAVAHTRREAVERFVADGALGHVDIGVDERIADGPGQLRGGIERAGDGCASGAGERREVRQGGVADGSVAEDQAAVARLPLVQTHRHFELRARRAAGQDGIPQPQVLRRCVHVRAEGVEAHGQVREAGDAQAPGNPRVIQLAGDRAIENHGAAALELHRQRGGALAQCGQKIVEIAGFQAERASRGRQRRRKRRARKAA